MPFTLTIEPDVRDDVDAREIARRIRAMVRALRLADEISFVLSDDDHVRALNATYRGKDRTTDVLAFALEEGEFSSFRGSLLGDVIVSVPTAIRQARRARKAPLEEITMLLAHGLLHLLGWDHDTKAKDRAMRAEVARLTRGASRPASRGAPARTTRVRNPSGKHGIAAVDGPRTRVFQGLCGGKGPRKPIKKAET